MCWRPAHISPSYCGLACACERSSRCSRSSCQSSSRGCERCRSCTSARAGGGLREGSRPCATASQASKLAYARAVYEVSKVCSDACLYMLSHPQSRRDAVSSNARDATFSLKRCPAPATHNENIVSAYSQCTYAHVRLHVLLPFDLPGSIQLPASVHQDNRCPLVKGASAPCVSHASHPSRCFDSVKYQLHQWCVVMQHERCSLGCTPTKASCVLHGDRDGVSSVTQAGPSPAPEVAMPTVHRLNTLTSVRMRNSGANFRSLAELPQKQPRLKPSSIVTWNTAGAHC